MKYNSLQISTYNYRIVQWFIDLIVASVLSAMHVAISCLCTCIFHIFWDVQLFTVLHIMYPEYFEWVSSNVIWCFLVQENEQRQKQEERAAQRTITNNMSKKKSVLKSADSEACLVDRLMAEIRSGTFKLRRSEGWGIRFLWRLWHP